MAWARVEVCDICQDPAKYKKALAIGKSSQGARVCPPCARKASISVVDNVNFWRFYLCDSDGVASAVLDQIPMSLGPVTKHDLLRIYQTRLAEISGRAKT